MEKGKRQRTTGKGCRDGRGSTGLQPCSKARVKGQQAEGIEEDYSFDKS